jgi:NADPH:quinone reductase-like Zn-dependent oxidoreductase
MKRIEFDTFGDPSVLHLVETETPVPGEGDVLVRNVAMGVNPFDWKFVSGRTGGKEREFPLTPGNEGAGVVEAVGSGVDGLAIGDEVIWYTFLGGYATHTVVANTKLWAKPADVPFEVGATLPVAAATAWSAVTQAGVGPGDLVLVHAASGGVGSAGVQIALALGARVIGTVSERNQDFVRSLGAEPVVYGEGLADRVRAIGDVTAIADFVGSEEAAAATLELMPGLDRAITTARPSASQDAGLTHVKSDAAAMPAVIELVASGKLVVEIAERFPLADAAAALELSKSGHVRGKIVLLA